jgi:hypothetical protein
MSDWYDWYELIGQTPVRIEGDIIECARRFEGMDRRVASTTVLGMCLVSTVFLGLDHSCGGGPPLLFETMAFWGGEGGYEQTRCSTWLEAQEQHARMCAKVARPRAVLAYIRRRLRDWWDGARRDLGRRWRDVRGVEPSELEKLIDRGEW